MEQSIYLEANKSSANQEISHNTCAPQVHYRIQTTFRYHKRDHSRSIPSHPT